MADAVGPSRTEHGILRMQTTPLRRGCFVGGKLLYYSYMFSPHSKLNKLFRVFFPQQNPEVVKRVYNIPDSIKLEVELTPDGWFVAEAPDFPGLYTQARSQQELLDMVNDAVLCYFDVPRFKADFLFDQINVEGLGVIQYKANLQTA